MPRHRLPSLPACLVVPLAATALVVASCISGCGGSGGVDDYGQQFEKPADMPAADSAPVSFKRDKSD